MDVWAYGRLIILGMVLALGTACQTESVVSSDGRPLPEKPRPAPAAPETARANRMVFIVGGKPEDTNRNGYPDLIRATVALFAHPHPTSIRQDGEFLFQLFPQGRSLDGDVQPIAEWRKSGEAVAAARSHAQWGPNYQFQLSLLAQGPRGDVHTLTAADLRATFIPADGSSPIHNEGVRSIQIGRR